MTQPRVCRLFVSLLLIGGLFRVVAAAQSDRPDDVRRVQRATEIFRTVFRGPGDAIPRNLLKAGQCMVIIPGYKNLAFGIGGAYGKGIATCRNNVGPVPTPPPGTPLPSTRAMGTGWSAPIFVALGGASLGPQIGVESADVVMVFQSREGLESVLNNKLRLGASAAAAAGPIGRRVEAATDAAMRSQVVAYARSRGLFAGVNINGAILQPDESGNRAMYPHQYWQDILAGKIQPEKEGQTLVSELNNSPITNPRLRPPTAAGQPAGIAETLNIGPGAAPPEPYDVGIAWEHITGDIGLDGWTARAGWRPLLQRAPGFSLVTNFGRATGSTSLLATTVNSTEWTVLVGPEFDIPHRVFDPYAHVLLGWARLSQDTNSSGATSSASFNSFAWDIGGGLKINLTRWADIRLIQVDLIHTSFTPGGGASHARFSIGGSFHF